MINEYLKIELSCATCGYFEPNEDPNETKGTCHVRSPSEDKFPERDSAIDWCGQHTTARVGRITPDVVEMLLPAATDMINSVGGLEVGTITKIDPGERELRNKVTAQKPVGGTPVAVHSKINLTVTK